MMTPNQSVLVAERAIRDAATVLQASCTDAAECPAACSADCAAYTSCSKLAELTGQVTAAIPDRDIPAVIRWLASIQIAGALTYVLDGEADATFEAYDAMGGALMAAAIAQDREKDALAALVAASISEWRDVAELLSSAPARD